MLTRLLLVFGAIWLSWAEIPLKRFEYKYSFKGPYLAQKDGSVPFWTYGGSAIASEENVRITPSLRSKKGQIWTKNQTSFDFWEVELMFRVTGRGRIGADGLAFWFTEAQGVEGGVFGSNDNWKGLGLFFDSFDNDNKHNNPYIMAIVNDGTLSYDHHNDGNSQQLSGCLRDYRNKPFPIRAKVEYYKNTLTVLIHNGMTDSDQDYELCFRADNINLPKRGYFGMSAATGGLADDHDVLKFLVSSLYPPDGSQQPPAISDVEKEKLAKEFEDYRQRLEQQKEEYRKENPNAGEKTDGEWFDSEQQRELLQIFQGQSRMFDAIRDLHRKMDEIIGRQERALSMLSSQSQGHVQSGQPIQGQFAPDALKRHEIDSIMNTQREIVTSSHDLKNLVGQIHQKVGSLPSQGGAVPSGYDFHSLVAEMKDGLNVIKRDLSSVNSRTGGACPTQTCVSTTIFVVASAIHLIILVAYLAYRDSKAAQAKKFY